jgi:T3SS (YopN, CesT) and YbjN peptide-binding chaperone 3
MTRMPACLATELARRLADERQHQPRRITLRVTGHTESASHRQTVETTLRELRSFWGKNCFGIFAHPTGRGHFVQAWFGHAPTVAGEASDCDAYRTGHLPPEARQRLLELGWHDPKKTPYESHYSWLWDWNYAREWPLELGLIASDVARALHEVYRVGPEQDLEVTLDRTWNGGEGEEASVAAYELPPATPCVAVVA